MLLDRVDNSGIRLYLTPNLRKHDVGILSFGTGSQFWDLQMPPKINEIMFTSVCYPECFDVILKLKNLSLLLKKIYAGIYTI